MDARPQQFGDHRALLLSPGQHAGPTPANGACVMEFVSYIAGERWSDRPKCVCLPIRRFTMALNDCGPQSLRDALLARAPRLVEEECGRRLARCRAEFFSAAVMRRVLPLFLRRFGHHGEAEAFETAPVSAEDAADVVRLLKRVADTGTGYGAVCVVLAALGAAQLNDDAGDAVEFAGLPAATSLARHLETDIFSFFPSAHADAQGAEPFWRLAIDLLDEALDLKAPTQKAKRRAGSGAASKPLARASRSKTRTPGPPAMEQA
jgi:hypothetical protein